MVPGVKWVAQGCRGKGLEMPGGGFGGVNGLGEPGEGHGGVSEVFGGDPGVSKRVPEVVPEALEGQSLGCSGGTGDAGGCYWWHWGAVPSGGSPSMQ